MDGALSIVWNVYRQKTSVGSLLWSTFNWVRYNSSNIRFENDICFISDELELAFKWITRTSKIADKMVAESQFMVDQVIFLLGLGWIFEICRWNKEPTTRGPVHLITLNYTLLFMENYKSNCTCLQASAIRFVTVSYTHLTLPTNREV